MANALTRTDPTARAGPLPPPDALAPVAAPPEALVLSGGWQIEGLPATIRRAGPQAAERTVEFFTAQIRNPHTRAAYGTAVTATHAAKQLAECRHGAELAERTRRRWAH